MGAHKDRLKQDLAAAMRARDDEAKSTIRSLLAAFTVEEVAGDTPRVLTDDQEQAIIRQELRKRRDSARPTRRRDARISRTRSRPRPS